MHVPSGRPADDFRVGGRPRFLGTHRAFATIPAGRPVELAARADPPGPPRAPGARGGAGPTGGESVGPSQQRSGGGRRLLLVDDQPFFLAMGQNIFRARGYEVQTACSGSEALAAVRAARPDAIILDVEMPGMDGIETCRRRKAEPATGASTRAVL